MVVVNLPDLREEGNGEFLLRELVPVEGLKPSVILNVICAVLKASISLSHVCHQQVLDKTLCVPKI